MSVHEVNKYYGITVYKCFSFFRTKINWKTRAVNMFYKGRKIPICIRKAHENET